MKIAAAVIAALLLVSPTFAACPTVSFTRTVIPVASNSGALAGSTPDLNGDGRSDVVVYYNNNGGLQPFLSNGDGTFTPGTLYNNSFINGADAGDIDGDGKPDIMAQEGFDLHIYYSTGTGTLTSGPVINMGVSRYYSRAADLNGDHLPDIVTADLDFNVSVLLQTAPGVFAPPVKYAMGNAVALQAADLDGDGKLDIVTPSAQNDISWRFGNGDGTFGPQITLNLGPSSFGFVNSLLVYDFTHDGKADIAVGHIGEGVYIVQNDGNRNFHVAQHLVPAGAAYYLERGDFNSDGLQDILMSEYGGWNILYSQPNGTFSAPQFISAPELSSGPFASGPTVVGDFRGDGRADFASPLTNSSIDIFLNSCAPPPVITSVSPAFGPAAGGITVQIHGSSLLTTASVTFGGTQATITAISGNLITVTLPASSPGVVPVTVTTSGGTFTLPNAFTFSAPTTLTVPQSNGVVGQVTALHAFVSPVPDGGTVTFSEGVTILGTAPVVDGVATLPVVFNTIGTHTITATFNGTPAFGPSSGSGNAIISAVPVPTLSPFAMLIAVMALGMMGVWIAGTRG
jgi:hypothetical protein